MRLLALVLPAALLPACFGDHFGESLTLDAATGPASSSGTTGTASGTTDITTAGSTATTDSPPTGTATSTNSSAAGTTEPTTTSSGTTEPATTASGTTEPATTSSGTTEPATTSSGTSGGPNYDPELLETCATLCTFAGDMCGTNPLICENLCVSGVPNLVPQCQHAYMLYITCLLGATCVELSEALMGMSPAICDAKYADVGANCA